MYGTTKRTVVGMIAIMVAMCMETPSCISGVNRSRPYADKTPEIRNIEAIRHNALDGFYLTVEEGRKVKDNGRQIVFFDYGFDGDLDEVTIRQYDRRDYSTTNQFELDAWQPHFEKMRSRRFGKCD